MTMLEIMEYLEEEIEDQRREIKSIREDGHRNTYGHGFCEGSLSMAEFIHHELTGKEEM